VATLIFYVPLFLELWICKFNRNKFKMTNGKGQMAKGVEGRRVKSQELRVVAGNCPRKIRCTSNMN